MADLLPDKWFLQLTSRSGTAQCISARISSLILFALACGALTPSFLEDKVSKLIFEPQGAFYFFPGDKRC